MVGTSSAFLMDSLLASVPVAVDRIVEARQLSRERIREARHELGHRAGCGLDVTAFGSLARLEVTSESDFDYLVLVDSLPDDPGLPQLILKEADGLRSTWATSSGHNVREPGSSGLFGSAVGAFDMLDKIGLQRDTNESHSRRMLLLEESVSLLDPEVRDRTVRAALHRYLTLPTTKEDRPPRYLLNDVVRYWRTITVDYQAKADGSAHDALRSVKLTTSRKVMFAGTAMALLLCGKDGRLSSTVDSLVRVVDTPPLDRLLLGYDLADGPARAAMHDVLAVYNRYLQRTSRREWRETVAGTPDRPGWDTEEYDEARADARTLQAALERIFFDWDVVREDARRSLVF